jgi:hypothetical protein
VYSSRDRKRKGRKRERGNEKKWVEEIGKCV